MKGRTNPIAKALRSPHLGKRIVAPRKGAGSYSRKGRRAPPASGRRGSLTLTRR